MPIGNFFCFKNISDPIKCRWLLILLLSCCNTTDVSWGFCMEQSWLDQQEERDWVAALHHWCFYSLHHAAASKPQMPQALASLKTTGGPTIPVGMFWLLSEVIFSLLLAINICLTFKERLTFRLLSSYKMQDLHLLNCWQIWNRCHVTIDITWWWHFSRAFPNGIFKVHIVKWNNQCNNFDSYIFSCKSWSH